MLKMLFCVHNTIETKSQIKKKEIRCINVNEVLFLFHFISSFQKKYQIFDKLTVSALSNLQKIL